MNQQTKHTIIILLQGRFQGISWTDFMMTFPNLEAAYDTLSDYLTKGLVLHQVKISQNGQWNDWPVDVFTTETLTSQTGPLLQEVDDLLALPTPSTPADNSRQAGLRCQICFYEAQIHRTNQRIARTEAALLDASPQRGLLLCERRHNRLSRQLRGQQAALSQLQASCQRVMHALKTPLGDY